MGGGKGEFSNSKIRHTCKTTHKEIGSHLLTSPGAGEKKKKAKRGAHVGKRPGLVGFSLKI